MWIGIIIIHRVLYIWLNSGRQQGGKHARIQLELLGMTMVDVFLACRKQMLKLQTMDESTSVFWKFVHVVSAQLDDRPWSEN